MKRNMLMPIFAVIFMALVACSSSEDPSSSAEINGRSFFKSLRQGEISASYKLADFSSYAKDNENDKWRPILLEGLYLNGVYIFHNGEIYEPLTLVRGSGRHILELPYKAYCMATGFSKSIYVVTPLEYFEENHSFTFRSIEYNIESATQLKLKLNLTQYYPTQYGEIWKTEMEYERMPFPEDEIKNGLIFYSEGDACLYIVGMLREQFGESFDLNPYLEELGIHNEVPIIVVMDELEQEIKRHYRLD